jgi:hypothetical protein
MDVGSLRSEWYGIPFGHQSSGGATLKIPRFLADLIIWQRHAEQPYVKYASAFKNPVHDHFLQACRDTLTTRQLRIHPWFEELAHAYTNNQEVIYLGAASTGKSLFTGLAFLMDLVADIGNLYACMVSTDKQTLQQRSFASAVEYLNCLTANGIPVPLKFVGSKCAIIPTSGSEDLQGVKSMIKGVAISEGSDQDAKRSLLGIHLPRIRSAADEFENMGVRSKAFVSAQANMRMGCTDYKMVIAFNPQSLNSPGCRIATPKDPGGWGVLDPDTAKTWYTKENRCVVRLDGLKSPGITDPSLTFLPTKKSIEELVKAFGGNWDHPDVWSMVRGFPALNRPEATVLTDAEVITYKMCDQSDWRGDSAAMLVGGLDPAFTADGDDCVLQLADIGYRSDSILTIRMRDPIKFTLEASSKIPMSYQIVGQLKTHMEDTGLKMQYLAIDDSGTQSIADIVAKELAGGFLRVSFGNKASDMPVSMADTTLANKKYGNLITELWMSLAELGRYGQIRRFPEAAVSQFTRRRFHPSRKPRLLETKAEFKQRTGLGSPDEGDACALCIAVARFVLGVKAGASLLEPEGRVVNYQPVDMERMLAINNLKSTYGIR